MKEGHIQVDDELVEIPVRLGDSATILSNDGRTAMIEFELGKPGYLLVDTKTGNLAPVNVYGEALTDMVDKAMDANKDEPIVVTPEGSETGHPVAGDVVAYNPDVWYTPTDHYPPEFYERGNLHYVPENSEKARNPMFRNVREFQEIIKLEIKVQNIYDAEYKKGVLLEHTSKAAFRKQRLEQALHALDEYYDGTVIEILRHDTDPDNG